MRRQGDWSKGKPGKRRKRKGGQAMEDKTDQIVSNGESDCDAGFEV